MEIAEQEYIPHDSYGKSWALLALMVALIGWAAWMSYHPRLTTFSTFSTPLSAPSSGYQWFMVLHLPEVPHDSIKTAQDETRYDAWLGALLRAGYHPLLLSDVASRLQQGIGLPPKTIVLLFDPGYYHTYETISPILSKYRTPAVWLTDRTALARGDKHYINRHMARDMSQSGFWDVGYFGEGCWSKHQTSAALELTLDSTLLARWAPNAGRSAINWSSAFASLQRLDISPKWTDQELLDRLALEIPLQGTVHLGVKRIQNQTRGWVLDANQSDKHFDLKTPLSANTADLYWTATRGHSDASLDLKIPTYFGEVFLWLRADVPQGYAVGVGFTHDRLYIDQYLQGKRHRLRSIVWSSTPRPIAAHVVISGDTLEVSAPAIEPIRVKLEPMPATVQGLVRLTVHDRLRGAAYADGVELTFTPQSQNQTTGPILITK